MLLLWKETIKSTREEIEDVIEKASGIGPVQLDQGIDYVISFERAAGITYDPFSSQTRKRAHIS